MAEMIPLENAPDAVKDLISRIGSEPIVFTQAGRQVATLTPSESDHLTEQPKRRKFGQLKGWLTIVEDDDEHLKAFKEYMP